VLFYIFVSVVALAFPADAQTSGTDASVVAGLASTSNLVRWTGTLPEAAGRSVNVSFALYQESAGGLPLWSETQLVKVGSDGHYTVLLGASSAEGLPQALFQAGEARWIEARLIIAQQIIFSSGNAISSDESNAAPPSRHLLTAVPYAFKSTDADTLAGRAADDYVTREDLQSAVANQVQAISSMHTSLPVVGTPSQIVGTPLPIGGTPKSPFSTLTGEGTSGYLPTWIGSAILGNSIIAESGSSVGIGTNTPATTLDVNGDSTLRGVVSLLAPAATFEVGTNSPPLQLGASTYSSASNTAVPQNYIWQAQSAGNNTASPSANLVLLFGSGTTEPTATGLSISPNGQITFALGQTFPGVSTSTLTGVTAGPGLTGGGSDGTVTLALAVPVSIYNGGTGASTAVGALSNLGAAALSGANFTGAVTIPNLTTSTTPVIDVRAYGAVGDSNGTTGNGTDNYAAIHAACAAASSGGHILFPAASGAYRINFARATQASPLNACLIYANGVTVEGNGRDSQIFMDGWTVANGMANSDGGAGKQVATVIAYGDSTHSVVGGTVKNLYITGIWNESDQFSGTTYSRAKGVGLYNAKDIDVEYIECLNIAGNCVNWSGNSGAGTQPGVRLSFITANYSAEGGVNFMGGTNLGSMSNSRITNSAGAGIETACDDCSFDNNKFSGNAIGLDSAGSRVTITGNESYSNRVHGIYIDPQTSDCNDVTLSNNLIYSNTQAGIAVGSTCLHASITGGTAKNNGVYGVILFGGNTGTRIVGIDASDDQLSPTQANGISLVNSTNVIVEGNRSIGNTGQSIYLTGSTNAMVIGNMVDHVISVDAGSTGLVRIGNSGDSSLVANNVPLLNTTATNTYIYNAAAGGNVEFLDQGSSVLTTIDFSGNITTPANYKNSNGTILPSAAIGYTGTAASKVVLSDSPTFSGIVSGNFPGTASTVPFQFFTPSLATNNYTAMLLGTQYSSYNAFIAQFSNVGGAGSSTNTVSLGVLGGTLMTISANGALVSPAFTGAVDASDATQFKLPVGAGYASAANGECGYDSTNLNWHCWQNGVDNFKAVFPVASPPTSGHVAGFLKSTNSWSLQDLGAMPTALPPNGSASGDLSGSYPSPTVAKVNGGSIPVSKTIVGTDSNGRIVDARSATLSNNTSGTAAGLSGTPALPNGTTATTQSTSDASTDVATDAFVHNAITAALPVANSSLTVSSSTAVSANSCNGPYTVSMSGVTTGMTFNLTATSDTHAVTGWGSPNTGVLYFTDWPTNNTFNYYICNNTASSITTSGAVTFNIAAR
jgi:parallel beta-helix repeat protein